MTRRKGLGRLLNVNPHCYAAALGSCSTKLSQEHPLSVVLRLGKKLHVVVRRQSLGENQWRETLSQEVDILQASAPVLCESHNAALSTADAEAAKLSAALCEAGERSRSSLVRPFEAVSVNARLFGAWLCKFDCGYMAMTGQEPHPDFVRYAFGQETQSRLYFLFPLKEGKSAMHGDTRNLPIRTFRTTPGGPEAFHVTFEGLDVVVTTFSPREVDMTEIYADLPHGAGMVDRLRTLEYESAQFRIVLGWGDDTDEPRIVSPAGKLTPHRE